MNENEYIFTFILPYNTLMQWKKNITTMNLRNLISTKILKFLIVLEEMILKKLKIILTIRSTDLPVRRNSQKLIYLHLNKYE